MIKIYSIVVEMMAKVKIKIIDMKNIPYILELQEIFLSISKLLLNVLNEKFNLNRWIVRGLDREMNLMC